MVKVDLNQEPEDEEEQVVQEKGIDTIRREKRERMMRMKRKREEDALKNPMQPQPIVRAPPPAAMVGTGALERPRTGISGPLPEGWLDCPPYGQPLSQVRIIASKAPLGESFADLIEPGKRYPPALAVRKLKQSGKDIGLVIDLTNTKRYYRDQEWRQHNIQYVKIPCRGRDEVPDNKTVNEVIYQLWKFFSRDQRRFVLVHCTHGHNRTGYVIVHFLMRTFGGTLPERIEEFAHSRPPGIYKEDYLQALFREYHCRRPAGLLCPPTPEWKRAPVDLNAHAYVSADVDEDGEPIVPTEGEVLNERGLEIPMTAEDEIGDEVPQEQQRELQATVCKALGVKPSSHFPGSQPVSLDRNNMKLLRIRYFYTTWKADGVRYMLLLMRDGAYLVSRFNFSFRRIQMRFPVKGAWPQAASAPVHHLTLLDGEMVVDTTPDGHKERRYLVYDLMCLNGTSIVAKPFKVRWDMIVKEIIMPRKFEAGFTKHGHPVNPTYLYDEECFKVRRKDFWPLIATEKTLKMIPSLCHESDGLIFQGVDDEYVPHAHEGLLKWKFPHMNSVDFELRETPGGEYQLFLLGGGRGQLRQLEGALIYFPRGEVPKKEEGEQALIIECTWSFEDKRWVYMRKRTDKNTPNGWRVYEKVMGSIKDNITEENLLAEIESVTKLPMYKAKDEAVQREAQAKQREAKLHQQQLQQQQQQQRQQQQRRQQQPVPDSPTPPSEHQGNGH